MGAAYLQEQRHDASLEGGVQSSTTRSHKKSSLLVFLEEESPALLGIIGSYVLRMGLASGEEIKPVALEIFQETVLEALDHADRFDGGRRIMAWLLGIALNVIRRQKAAVVRRQRHELSLSHLSFVTRSSKPMNQDEMLDQEMASSQRGPEHVVEADEHVQALLALVSPEDQQVLRLAILEEFEREALAQRLGVTSGAARVRLHRALHRLRVAWEKETEEKTHD